MNPQTVECGKMVRIREEQPQDIEDIHEVNVRAFGRTIEADLVDKLRHGCSDLLSLVATGQNEIVGHALFSPVTIKSGDRTVKGMGLGPLSVLPEYQRREIGSELVRAGIAILKDRRCPFIIVLGHAGYYPRFGFEPASRHVIRSEWKVSDEVFMILVLNESEMRDLSGVARYLPEFSETL
jgi:putative acetyltransferase